VEERVGVAARHYNCLDVHPKLIDQTSARVNTA
jgi:hypothetical protein